MVDPTRTISIERLDRRGRDTDDENKMPAERLSMLWQLTLDAWALACRSLPAVSWYAEFTVASSTSENAEEAIAPGAIIF